VRFLNQRRSVADLEAKQRKPHSVQDEHNRVDSKMTSNKSILGMLGFPWMQNSRRKSSSTSASATGAAIVDIRPVTKLEKYAKAISEIEQVRLALRDNIKVQRYIQIDSHNCIVRRRLIQKLSIIFKPVHNRKTSTSWTCPTSFGAQP
jgi:hypothetical protein